VKNFAKAIFRPKYHITHDLIFFVQHINFCRMEESLAKKLHQKNKIFRGRENESNHYGYWK
jgi:hypothetical protein